MQFRVFEDRKHKQENTKRLVLTGCAAGSAATELRFDRANVFNGCEIAEVIEMSKFSCVLGFRNLSHVKF